MDQGKYVVMTPLGPGVIVGIVTNIEDAVLVKVPRETMNESGKSKYVGKYPFVVFRRSELTKPENSG